MTWAGADSHEILQACLQRYLEQFDVLVEFKRSKFQSDGDNRLAERLHQKTGDHWVQAVENIGKRILSVVGRRGCVVTLTPLQYGSDVLTTIVTNIEEVE